MYQLQQHGSGVKRLTDNSHIPNDERNGDWQTYQAWLDEGNAPLPADPDPVPTYRDLRAAAYPDYREFIDGMVKVHSPDPVISAEGDAQVRQYCEACLAVKALIPKT